MPRAAARRSSPEALDKGEPARSVKLDDEQASAMELLKKIKVKHRQTRRNFWKGAERHTRRLEMRDTKKPEMHTKGPEMRETKRPEMQPRRLEMHPPRRTVRRGFHK